MIAKRTRDLDYGRLVQASRRLSTESARQTLRVAILSDAATQQFVPLLQVLFHDNGVTAEVYEAPFDGIEIEAYNPSSGLYGFRPDVIVLANCAQALRDRYYAAGGGEAFAEAAAERVESIWDALEKNSTARLIQCNFPLPTERQFGHFDLKVASSLHSVTRTLNARIADLARQRGNVLLCDVESIASDAGRRQWFDDRLWYMSKTFCRLEHLPLVTQALVEITLASQGRVVKCVVLDLDNTLWGGVVGDDGPLGVIVGPHGDGESFHHFQQFLLSLKRRGILLTVCSKNDRDNAMRPFIENTGMVLKLDDITMFVANWDNKADNIRAIRDTLEIGFDSMVFLDDNPFERNLVRGLLPEVIVPELPEDPADYVASVSSLNLFEASSFSAEDVARPELYKQEAARRELRNATQDLDAYLASLDMTIEVSRFEKHRIPRIAQLLQRSNQFNLTTHRYSESECERMMLDYDRWIPLAASLSDRFGDHGLISIVILRLDADAVEITDWLMSCRVLVRGVEQYLMNEVVEIARQRGVSAITGRYIPTAKNKMVKDFFSQFGFTQVSEAGGRTDWRLDVDVHKPTKLHIRKGTFSQWTATA